jgi:hypothetical protein
LAGPCALVNFGGSDLGDVASEDKQTLARTLDFNGVRCASCGAGVLQSQSKANDRIEAQCPACGDHGGHGHAH